MLSGCARILRMFKRGQFNTKVKTNVNYYDMGFIEKSEKVDCDEDIKR